MIQSLIALGVGAATGFIFSIFKLPIPAPSVLPGIIGIFGIYAGGYLYRLLAGLF